MCGVRRSPCSRRVSSCLWRVGFAFLFALPARYRVDLNGFGERKRWGRKAVFLEDDFSVRGLCCQRPYPSACWVSPLCSICSLWGLGGFSCNPRPAPRAASDACHPTKIRALSWCEGKALLILEHCARYKEAALGTSAGASPSPNLLYYIYIYLFIII